MLLQQMIALPHIIALNLNVNVLRKQLIIFLNRLPRDATAPRKDILELADFSQHLPELLNWVHFLAKLPPLDQGALHEALIVRGQLLVEVVECGQIVEIEGLRRVSGEAALLLFGLPDLQQEVFDVFYV